MSGIGLFTGGINPRAVAALWQSGENSLMDDVRFLGGHGTNLPDGTRYNPYDTMHAADPDPRKRWDGQYPSLWVTNGGGGTFTNLWSVDTYASFGVLVSDTTTPGHVYELSNEHHARVEIALNRAQNWDFYAPQTEEEAGESQEAISLQIQDSSHITIANWHAYRVTRTVRPIDTAARIFNSGDIHFRNVHVNAESGLGTCDANGCATYLRASKFPAENSIRDLDPSYRHPRAGIRGAGLSGRAAGAGHGRHGQQGREAGRWFLFHLRRRGGRTWQALLRGQAPAAHLWLVARTKALPSSATIPSIR